MDAASISVSLYDLYHVDLRSLVCLVSSIPSGSVMLLLQWGSLGPKRDLMEISHLGLGVSH